MYPKLRNILMFPILFYMFSTTTVSAACFKDGRTITGTLRMVKTQYTRARALDKFVLDRKGKTCVLIGRGRPRVQNNIHRIELKISNARAYELKTLIGLKIAVKGTFKKAKGRSKKYIVQLRQATIVGSYDPRNGRFHKWAHLKKRIARINRRGKYEPEEYEYIRKDTTALTKLIRQTIPRYRDEDDYYEEEAPVVIRRPVRYKLVSFISDYFLQFPTMHPAQIVEFYAPTLAYNGDVGVTRERVVQIKVSRFRRNHLHSMRLVRRSIHIRRDPRYPNSYKVSFKFIERGHHEYDERWVRRSAELLIDLDMNSPQILAEKTYRHRY
ncbi:MAG: hypothetical protein ACRBBN_18140 [Methyloligellaceae bacterium]